ncbi:MAG: hypothetical protein KAU62_02020 [Candidatus Heimdallarchaeota archaeon]|nr:hypothetical protein [Candidatus Heimdallarchaeota archaeon]MCK4609910.1 hypothetical protein [Candidatus Heimdallarchaeota archaeon]
MSEHSSSTWDYPEEIDILKPKIVKEDITKSSIGLGTVFEEIERIKKQIDTTKADQNKISFTRRKTEIDETIDSLVIFTEKALERKLDKIPSLKNYAVEFDNENGIITVDYFIKNKLSIKEERNLADFEVVVLEKVNIYRIEFRRTYL